MGFSDKCRGTEKMNHRNDFKKMSKYITHTHYELDFVERFLVKREKRNVKLSQWCSVYMCISACVCLSLSTLYRRHSHAKLLTASARHEIRRING